MNTWDKMMVIEFLHIPTHLFRPLVGPLRTRYVNLRKASNTTDYNQQDLTLTQWAQR